MKLTYFFKLKLNSITRPVIKNQFQILSISILTITFFLQNNVLAWGGRGHHSICEAAVFLIQEEGLKIYLQNKPQIMGHLCNIPDTHWRSLSPEITRIGGPTHYVDFEVIGLKPKEVPADYKKIIQDYTGKPNLFKEGSVVFSVPEEFGSSWWRADQFFRRSLEAGKKLATLKAPENSKEEQNEKLPYNEAVFEFMVNLGIMGHFVGDNANPLHNTTDYDGYAANHGGIHSYYEDTSVSYFPGDLVAQILKKSKTIKKTFVNKANVIEQMRELSEVSAQEIKKIWLLDPIKKPSVVTIEKGVSFRTPAERHDGKVGYDKFNKLILEQLTRAAVLLAKIWDESYIQSGRPKLSSYKSYKYPFTPEFVYPDYYDWNSKEKIKK